MKRLPLSATVWRISSCSSGCSIGRVVLFELLGHDQPLGDHDQRRCEAEEREAERQARGTASGRGMPVDRVHGDERDRADRADADQPEHDELAAGVGRRPRGRSARARRAGESRPAAVSPPPHACLLRRSPISTQKATRTTTAIPQVTSPSGTGPTVPRAQPPRLSGMLRVVDVGDDRVELAVRDRALGEARHHVGPDPHRLGDLRVGRVLERRRQRTGDVAALGHDLVAAGAVVREQLHSLGEVPALGLRLRDRRAVAERGDVGGQRVDLRLAEERRAIAVARRRVAGAACSRCGGRSRRRALRRPEARARPAFRTLCCRSGPVPAVVGCVTPFPSGPWQLRQ